MPYRSDGSDVPSRIKGSKKRRQWAAVWNSTYEQTGDESRAYAAANSVYNRSKKLYGLISLIKVNVDELYEDTGQYDEDHEAHLRGELETWADYAESGPTFDPDGKYLCGSCDMRLGDDDCNRVVSPISFTTGGCKLYTIGTGETEDQPEMPQKLTQIEVAYTERPQVKGFGCSRCMFSAAAKKADSDGRVSWCAFWGLHIEPLACCFKNTGEDDVFAPLGDSTEDQEESEKIMIATSKSVTANELTIFCPLVKVDVTKREVWGVVTAEEPDKDGEICDYESTTPYYKEVVNEMSKATDGANIFPLRAMHGLVAAGKGISIEFRDEAKEIYMGFKVVDDAEWKKVEENVYTGFSQGGRYVKKWKDGDNTRYTAKPAEVSLVDMPCCTRAHFEYVKADGTIEMRKFSKTEEPAIPDKVGDLPSKESEVEDTCGCTCEECAKGDHSACTCEQKCGMAAGKKVAPEDMFKKEKKKPGVKYLVTDSEGNGYLPYTRGDGKPNHNLMGAAWAALFSAGGHRGNKYGGPDREKAKRKLKQIYAQEGMETPSEKAERIDALLKTGLEEAIQNRAYGQLNKGMYQVSNFAQILESVKYLWLSLEYEEEEEEDESPVPESVHEAYLSLLDNLLAYTEEQVLEEKEKEFIGS